MTTASVPDVAAAPQPHATSTKALVFREPNGAAVEHVPRPFASFGEAVTRPTLTTICRTDLHFVKGEYSPCGLAWYWDMNRWGSFMSEGPESQAMSSGSRC